MSNREGTCEERIGAHLAGRLEDFAKLNQDEPIDSYGLEGADEEERREAAIEQADNYPLSVELKRVVRIDLSTGGPGDWFECWVDEDGDIGRIEYHFNDWFDHASRVLDGSEYETAAAFCARFVETATLS